MTIESLILEFSRGNVPTKGVFSFYGNFMGKPGDTISHIKMISGDQEVVLIETGFETFMLNKPTGIMYDASFIKIESCERLVVSGRLIPSNSMEAFSFYTW